MYGKLKFWAEHNYHIAGIFGQWGNVVNCLPIRVLLNITSYALTDLLDLHGGKYSFFSNKLIFMGFIFIFASSAPFYNTGSHTHLVKFRSLDLFLNEKKQKLNPTKITRYTVQYLGSEIFKIMNTYIYVHQEQIRIREYTCNCLSNGSGIFPALTKNNSPAYTVKNNPTIMVCPTHVVR